MQEDDETRLDDLALICSNCHRMIHRKEKTLGRLTLNELKNFIKVY